MILSQSKVNDLLKVFENPKNIEPYNISYQKQEVENASKFINDYHLYGSPKLHQQTISINNQPQNIKTISGTQSINSQNQTINGQSIILSNNVQNLQNYEDVEIHHSITNLKNDTIKKQQKNISNKKIVFIQDIPNILNIIPPLNQYHLMNIKKTIIY